MNARSPIPLRPDVSAVARAERRSFVRACVAIALGSKRGAEPGRIVKSFDDARAEMILKAASSAITTTSASALQLTSTTVLPLLAPASASARLLAMARPLDLNGLHAIKLPYIGQSGRPPAVFVAEDTPGPVVDLTISTVTLGPTCKLFILTALTREMMMASASNAETIFSDALAVSAAQSLDAALFSNAAATSSTPAGLLNGVTSIPSAAATGAAGVAADLALLAGAIGSAGIDPSSMVVVTTPALAVKIRTLASPKLDNVILGSSSLAAGDVVAIVPQGLATGYDGGVEVELEHASHSALRGDHATTNRR